MDVTGGVRLVPGTAASCGQVLWPRVPRQGAHGLGPATLRPGLSFLTCETCTKSGRCYFHGFWEAFAGGFAATSALSDPVGFGEDAVLLLYPQISRQ